MSVALRFGDRQFLCDCYGEGCDLFHKAGEGFRCSGCGTYTQGSFEAIENPQETRIKNLEDALRSIRQLAPKQEIMKIIDEVLAQ